MHYFFLIVVLLAFGCSSHSSSIKPGILIDRKVEVSTEAQTQPHLMEVIIAVLNFKNNSPHKDWNYLRETISDLMATDFADKAGIKVVERQRLRQVIEELKLGFTGGVDPRTAQRIGKLLGANIVVLGSFTHLGNKLILTTRLIKVQTGEVMLGVVEDGSGVPDLPTLIERTSSKILAGIGKSQDSVR